MEQADRQSRRSALAHSYGEHRPVPQIESYWWDLTDPNSQPADKSVAEQSAPKQSNSAAGQVPSPKRRNSGDGGRSSRDLSNDDESESDFGGALNKEQSEKRKKRDLRRGSSRIVTDAITYRKVRIKNTDADIDEAYDPQRSRGTGTLTRAFPPIEWDRAIDGFRRRLLRYAALGLVPALVLPGWFGFWTGTCVTLVWVGALAFHFNRVGTSEWLDHKWDLERRRAQGHVHDQHISKQTAGKTGSKNGSRKLETVGGAEAGIQDKRESVEWTNTLLGGLWPIIDPKLFVSVVDLLEDIMQASIPSFIQTVRIADLSQGNHPIRIISIRTLPENEKPGDESANQTDTSADPKEQPQRKSEEGLFSGLKKDTSDPFVRGKSLGPGEGDSAEKSEEEDQQKQTEELGKFVNLEVAFAYRSLPVQGRKVYSKAKNAHLIIHFGLGLPGIFGGAFPVWVELRGIVGTMRIRVELVSEPPFVKHATISFMGLPKVEISAIPMIDLPVKLNAMNIPGLSTFISNSINTAIDEYVAPKSLTVDLGQLLVGDDIKKDTLALGAIAITIHSAQVKGSDLGGKSDPYVTVSYAKYSKPLFSTRIILGETEPTWRATAVVLVKADAFKVNERLALQIWDSDRISSDDELGRVEVDLFDLYRNRGKMMYRQSALHHSVRGKNIPGEICYSVGYFPKVLPTEDADGHSPKDTDLPKDFQDREEMQGDHRPKTMDAEEDRIIAMLPSDDYPSGILSIQVHEAFDLVRQYIGPTKGGDRSQRGRFSHPKGTEDATREEGDDLPSAYFRIRVNDETTYQSRVKPIQSQPFFQAGQERFLRDWRTTLIQIIVRDSRVRESDPMLGMLHLNLRDVFEGGSQVTKIYPLEGGIGHGRIRVSLLFRPLDLKLPRSLLGWEIASAIIKGSIHVEADAAHRSKLSHCSLHLRTSHGSHTLRHRDHSNREAGSDRIEWRNERLSLPVKKRFASPLVMSFKSNGLDLKGGVVAMGVLWMMTVPDSERILINMPIYEAKDYNRLEQNFWTYSEDLKEDIPDAKHYAHDPSSLPDPESFGLKRIGTVHFELLVLPGISSTHRRMFKKEPRGRIIIEGFDNAVRAGLREDFESQSQVEMEDENYPLNEHNGSGATRKVRAPANRREGLDSRIDEGDEDDIWGDEETDASAATYSDEMVRRNDSIGSRRPRRMTSQSTNGTSNSKGLRDKYRDWKEARTDLHSRHRGMAQVKAYRSVKWVKDSAKAGLVKAKYKFEMHERNPDIESEV